MDFNEFVYQLSQMTAPEILELVGSWVLRAVFGLFAIIAARYGYKIYNKEKAMKVGKFEATEFTQYKDELALDEQGNLKPTGKKIDVQAQIQSQRSKCMDRILDKYLENQIGLPESIPVYGDGTKLNVDPKEEYANAVAYAERLRERYNIPVEEYDKDRDKTTYISPEDVLISVSKDKELIDDIVNKNVLKSQDQLDYEAFLKWKEANSEKA